MTTPQQEIALAQLDGWLAQYPKLFVLTGAGVSTASGIPAYRDALGRWQHRQPIQYQAFIGSHAVRQRYWARSLSGWGTIANARANAAHRAIAALERQGYVEAVVTQNVDGLHQQGGSRRVVDLHGRLDQVICLGCRWRWRRSDFQTHLAERNPRYVAAAATVAPDGDAQLEGDFSDVDIPACPHCGGLLKPNVVFYGESVPRPRVERCYRHLARADALLVVGSSLMVYSSYRFCRAAREHNKPIAAINLGKTRGDELLSFKIAAPCEEVLAGWLAVRCQEAPL